QQECIVIRGNHDIWCENWLRTGETDKIWLEHGGEGTMESYSGFSESEKKEHLQFFENMLPFYIDDKNRLFIHAGFTSQYGVEYELLKQNYYFDRSLWYESLKLKTLSQDDKDNYPARNKLYDEIYIGHTPTINFNEYEPMRALNVYDIDTGAAFYGRLSAMDIDSKKVYQTEVVSTLYPGEKGRNKS
ncbi:MAG: serine/threonine protein phosphatase, partial [Flavobacteriaceae bacterium]|nr:serine/threonine protein phosphatase [Flavobacteriaceae bacterium]